MKQTVLAFITPVRPGCEAWLEELLAEISAKPKDNKYVPFANLRSLHFASLVILQDRKKGARLVFENNFDGPLDRYLDDLLQHAMFGLHEIYRCCEGYPNTSAGGGDGLWTYLREHVVWPNTARVGNVGRDVERIRQECDLRRALDDELDQVGRARPAEASPAAIRRRLQELVQQRTRELGWVAKAPPPRQSPLEQVLAWSKVGATLLGALVFLPVLLPTALVWVRMLQRREARDKVWTGVPSPEHLQRLEASEDPPGYVQNHVASLAYVKPGRFRRATLRLVLWLVNMSSSVSTGGKLGGVSTIHFAHWSLLDDGESLLFLSNFDGSWESYLDDFIDLASTGLSAHQLAAVRGFRAEHAGETPRRGP
jgi:hypothetical protein